MGRSDTQLVVRQASLHVWKIVVSNTPRTLREILPTLFTLLLGFLASDCPDKRTVTLLLIKSTIYGAVSFLLFHSFCTLSHPLCLTLCGPVH